MNRTGARGVATLGVAVLVAAALAACGGSGSPSTSTTTSSQSSATNAAATTGATGATGGQAARRSALVACLKKYGVNLPSFRGRFGASGASGPRFPSGASGASGRRFPFGATGASGPPGAGFPGGGGGFASNPKLAQAFQKCGGLGFNRFGASGRAGVFNTRLRAELTSFVACMKNNGEALPAPNLSGRGSIFGNVNQTTTAFKTAYAKCKSILTFLNRRPGPAGPTGSTGATGA